MQEQEREQQREQLQEQYQEKTKQGTESKGRAAEVARAKAAATPTHVDVAVEGATL